MANTKILMNTSGKLYTYSGKLMLNVPYVYGDNCPNVVMEHTPKYLKLTIDGTDYDETKVKWTHPYDPGSKQFIGTWNGEYLLTQDEEAPCMFVLDNIASKEITMMPSPYGDKWVYTLNKIRVVQVTDDYDYTGENVEVNFHFTTTQEDVNNPLDKKVTNSLKKNVLVEGKYVNENISSLYRFLPRVVSKRFSPGGSWYDNNTYDQEWTIKIQPQWTEPS